MIPTRSLLTTLAVTASVFAIGTAFANDKEKKDACCEKPGTACCDKAGAACCSTSEKTEDAWLKQAKAAYPLDTCVVSGDKLEGDMGQPIDYVYKEAGKPDRLVRFCCKGCVKDFKKDPAKYLKKIDDALAAKAKTPAPVTHS